MKVAISLRYITTLTGLLIRREIDARHWLWAVRERPVVIAGRSGGWVVDQDFRM